MRSLSRPPPPDGEANRHPGRETHRRRPLAGLQHTGSGPALAGTAAVGHDAQGPVRTESALHARTRQVSVTRSAHRTKRVVSWDRLFIPMASEMVIVGYTELNKINSTFFFFTLKNVATRKSTTTHVAAYWTVMLSSSSTWVRIQARPCASRPAPGEVLTLSMPQPTHSQRGNKDRSYRL